MTNPLTILTPAVLILFAWGTTFGQSPRAQLSANADSNNHNPSARAIAALSRLDRDVIVYRALGDFEEGRKLSSVPLATFERDFNEVCSEVTPLLDEMPASKLKNDLSNALDSYRDGLFWWKQTDEPRVVNVRSLSYATRDRTAAEAALRATIPYTVAIHWRHAHDYLVKSARNIGR